LSALAISINSEFREIAHRQTWVDPDRFGLRLSEAISKNLNAGFDIGGSVLNAVDNVPTAFYRANSRARGKLTEELIQALEIRGIKAGGLLEVLRQFKRFAERELSRDFVEFQNEAIGRSHLQTHLNNLGRTYREVPVGAGRSDILLFLPETTEIIETKVWGGRKNHNDGIVELNTYMKGEGLLRGYYVVFEYHKRDPITLEEELDPDGGIDTIFIHIPLTSPSTLGQSRRRQKP
jgi:hypothetical protein